jgi:type IV pilus assembly protein PilO
MATSVTKDTSFEGLPVVAKGLILLLIIAVLTVVYYLALHMSVADDLSTAETRHVQLQQELQEQQRREQEYLRLTQELANREAIDRHNKRSLPEKAEIAAFLQDLNRLADLSGLRMRRVEPRPEEAQELYVRIPVSLEVSGRYHQLMKFFYGVGRLDRAINMENINLANPRREDDELVLDVSVRATTFRRPTAEEGGQAGAAPGAAPGGGRPGGSG